MDITSIRTGDIFYHNSYTAHDDKTHRYKCRVLFVGSENIFYDAWWDSINKWTFVPVRKQLAYYRFPLTQLQRLSFNGFEANDPKVMVKLFLKSPEILLTTTKNEFVEIQDNKRLIEVHSDAIAFIPIGAKGGTLKPILFDTKQLTEDFLKKKIVENQNLDFIQTKNIVVHRIGLYSGVPSYCIRTQ